MQYNKHLPERGENPFSSPRPFYQQQIPEHGARHFLHNEWVQSIVLLLLTRGVCLLLTPLIVRMIPQFAAQKLLAKSGSRE